jgi:hypothetical protein
MKSKKPIDDPIKEDTLLRFHLDSYDVDIPEFPAKRSRSERFVGYLASPAANPFEQFFNNGGGLVKMTVTPLILGVLLTLIQVIHFAF